MRQEARSQLAATKAGDSQAARRGGELGGGLGGASPSLLLPTAGLSAGLGLGLGELHQSRERQQEGQISEMREIGRASEARQQALLERLALQTRDLDEAQAELGALRRVAAEVRIARNEHAVALELLGEKQEELEAKQEELDALKQSGALCGRVERC